MSQQTCLQCGAPLPPPAKTGGNPRRFCNDVCRARWNRAQKPGRNPGSGAGSGRPVITTAGRWKPSTAARREPDKQPTPCPSCGSGRTWSPYATTAICRPCLDDATGHPQHGVRVEVVRAAALADERRVPAPREAKLQKYALDEYIGDELLDPIDELLRRDDLRGGTRKFLKSIRKDADNAADIIDATALREILQAKLAVFVDELPAGVDDGDEFYPDAIPGEVVDEEEARQSALDYGRWISDTLGIRSGLLDGGMYLPGFRPASRLARAPVRALPASPDTRQHNPAAAFRARGNHQPEPEPAGSEPVPLRPMPPDPLPAHPLITSRQQAAYTGSVHARLRDVQAQPLISELLTAGPAHLHDAIALARGYRPEYPRRQSVLARRSVLGRIRHAIAS
jgi:hypothetical protein